MRSIDSPVCINRGRQCAALTVAFALTEEVGEVKHSRKARDLSWGAGPKIDITRTIKGEKKWKSVVFYIHMVGIFYIGSIFCAFVTIYLLLYNENAIKTFANYLLACYFIFCISCLSVYVLVLYGWIIDVPYLYKTSAPINFLLPPLTYLYVRVTLFNKQKLDRLDIFHIIPFLIVAINYLPFYLLPISEKNIL